jgi:hypothetical protein
MPSRTFFSSSRFSAWASIFSISCFANANYECMYAFKYVSKYVCIPACMYAYIQACMYVRIYVFIWQPPLSWNTV